MDVVDDVVDNVVDDDVNFIRRPQVVLKTDDNSHEGDFSPRPEKPPNDQSLKSNKSLGLMPIPESLRPFIKPKLNLPCPPTPTKSRSRRGFSGRGRDSLPWSEMISSPLEVINPFTPTDLSPESLSSKWSAKRASSKRFDGSVHNHDLDSENNSVASNSSLGADCKRMRPRLSDFNYPRFKQEFLEIGIIGFGSFGTIYKCMNICNGVTYAIKKSIKPTADQRLSHNEIYAHAALEHPNIVRNYSNWSEDGYVYMQNEYCSGGSLEDEIKKGPMDEKHLRRVLEHVCQGLRFIHSKNLAHMDIKPGNIFIHKGAPLFFKNSSDQDKFSDDDETDTETVYKIGDLGLVTRIDKPKDVQEGDGRYLPKELLNDDYSNLTKADIFSLGLTLYEAAGGVTLPNNGDEWHAIREGKLKHFPHLSHELNALIKRMIHSNPDHRPSAEDLLTEISSLTVYKRVKKKHELKASRQKVRDLEKQLEDALKFIKHHNKDDKTLPNNNKGKRLVGGKATRSRSNNSF